jgi:DNA processing protein
MGPADGGSESGGGRLEREFEPDLEDRVLLAMIPGVGPAATEALLARFGTAGSVLEASVGELKQVPGVGKVTAEKIATARERLDARPELVHAEELGIRVVARGGSGYPPALLEIHDPPSILYMAGEYRPEDELAVALVGARRATPYGIRMAERLATSLARVGITVVSGLARGIDAAAHRAALKAGGRTIAVLAGGLARIYPPEHEELAREVRRSGVLISEKPLRTRSIAELFPQRNRLISGLSLGVVVVEAAPRSGSLSTARHASEQGREVFAVPGPADTLNARGCHALIRDGAKLVERVEDILEELGPLVREVDRGKADEPPVRRPAELVLTDQERGVLGLLGDGGTSVDEVVARAGLTAAQALATLAVLEMRRLVRRLPGNLYVRA